MIPTPTMIKLGGLVGVVCYGMSTKKWKTKHVDLGSWLFVLGSISAQRNTDTDGDASRLSL